MNIGVSAGIHYVSCGGSDTYDRENSDRGSSESSNRDSSRESKENRESGTYRV